ncbi:hypothetical protein C4375_14630 [Devosia sp. I507]|nr:hypothetical protein C4375_14630 [Devosia sp. I507]
MRVMASSFVFKTTRSPTMKKILSAILALTIVAGVAAPAFAWTGDTCPFSDKSMCDVVTLTDDTSDD